MFWRVVEMILICDTMENQTFQIQVGLIALQAGSRTFQVSLGTSQVDFSVLNDTD